MCMYVYTYVRTWLVRLLRDVGKIREINVHGLRNDRRLTTGSLSIKMRAIYNPYTPHAGPCNIIY